MEIPYNEEQNMLGFKVYPNIYFAVSQMYEIFKKVPSDSDDLLSSKMRRMTAAVQLKMHISIKACLIDTKRQFS